MCGGGPGANGPGIDLDAYCARIGHDGPRRADFATLATLQARQADAIAFEALDVLMDRGVDLTPAAVDAKLLAGGRGGYCFEQNGFLRRALTAMGFRVEMLLARVRWNRPADAPLGPRTHMALRVRLGGVPWLVDAGFGGCVPTAPLRLDTAETQPTPHDSYRVVPMGDDLLLQVLRADGWLPVYQLARTAQLDADIALANWHTATHPDSPFRQGLYIARTTPEMRLNLRDNRLTMRRPDGASESVRLDADGLETALVERFGLPPDPARRPLLERAAAVS